MTLWGWRFTVSSWGDPVRLTVYCIVLRWPCEVDGLLYRPEATLWGWRFTVSSRGDPVRLTVYCIVLRWPCEIDGLLYRPEATLLSWRFTVSSWGDPVRLTVYCIALRWLWGWQFTSEDNLGCHLPQFSAKCIPFHLHIITRHLTSRSSVDPKRVLMEITNITKFSIWTFLFSSARNSTLHLLSCLWFNLVPSIFSYRGIAPAVPANLLAGNGMIVPVQPFIWSGSRH